MYSISVKKSTKVHVFFEGHKDLPKSPSCSSLNKQEHQRRIGDLSLFRGNAGKISGKWSKIM
jgi:hypothetical protein